MRRTSSVASKSMGGMYQIRLLDEGVRPTSTAGLGMPDRVSPFLRRNASQSLLEIWTEQQDVAITLSPQQHGAIPAGNGDDAPPPGGRARRGKPGTVPPRPPPAAHLVPHGRGHVHAEHVAAVCDAHDELRRVLRRPSLRGQGRPVPRARRRKSGRGQHCCHELGADLWR